MSQPKSIFFIPLTSKNVMGRKISVVSEAAGDGQVIIKMMRYSQDL